MGELQEMLAQVWRDCDANSEPTIEIPIMVQIERATWQATNARIVALEAENAALRAAFGDPSVNPRLFDALRACTIGFGDLTPPTSSDLPLPVLRPDGTLAPQPKPLPVLKTHKPSRRIGG